MAEAEVIPPSVGSAEERRVRNLSKRVKLHSKRMRQLWSPITHFLALRDAVSLASTCHRLQRVLEEDSLWQNTFARVAREPITRLLLPRTALAPQHGLTPRQNLQRLLKARRSKDPTNALRLRLREAEKDAFRLATWQLKIRETVRVNVPVALALCGLSLWAFCTDATMQRSFFPTDVSHKKHKMQVDPIKAFLVVEDVLLLVAVVVVSAGYMADSALYSVAVLAAIQVATMLQSFVAWQALPLLLHAGVVALALLVNAAVAKRKHSEYQRALAGFTPSY